MTVWRCIKHNLSPLYKKPPFISGKSKDKPDQFLVWYQTLVLGLINQTVFPCHHIQVRSLTSKIYLQNNPIHHSSLDIVMTPCREKTFLRSHVFPNLDFWTQSGQVFKPAVFFVLFCFVWGFFICLFNALFLCLKLGMLVGNHGIWNFSHFCASV